MTNAKLSHNERTIGQVNVNHGIAEILSAKAISLVQIIKNVGQSRVAYIKNLTQRSRTTIHFTLLAP